MKTKIYTRKDVKKSLIESNKKQHNIRTPRYNKFLNEFVLAELEMTSKEWYKFQIDIYQRFIDYSIYHTFNK